MYRNESVAELYRQLDPADVLYSYMIGVAMGAFGAGADIATGRNAEANAELKVRDADEAAYLRRMEEIGYLPAESSKNAAHEGAAESPHVAGEKENGSLQGDDEKSIIQETNEQSRKTPGSDDRALVHDSVATASYSKRMGMLGESKAISDIMTFQARKTLWRRNGTSYEDLVFIDPSSGEVQSQRSDNREGSVRASDAMRKMVEGRPGEIISMHNHPHSMLPSLKDLENAKRYKYGLVLCHNGKIIKYSVSQDANTAAVDAMLDYLQNDFSAGKDISLSLALLEKYGVIMEVFE